MARLSASRPSGRAFAAVLVLAVVTMLSLHVPAIEGVEPGAPPRDPAAGSPSSTSAVRGHGGGRTAAAPRTAVRHILVQLHPRTDETRFLQNAGVQGLRRLSRVHGTRWLRMAVPAGSHPAQAAAAARTLPGVLRATLDPVVTINDQIPPRDPIYKDDDDPSTKPCDPFFEICDPWTLVDQWGLFKVEAEAGWAVQRGSADVVIAILDSGVDLDHDDLRGKLWTNPGEIPGNGIDDDGNGLVDDVHGADFAGSNAGGLADDPASEDGNPDIPKGGTWVEDPTAIFGVRFVGDPAAGDGDDNNLDGLIDIGVSHGTYVAGIAAAMTDNVNPHTGQFEGMAGACWHCKLMAVRLINAEGWAFGSDAAAAIHYAATMGAHVINISWGVDLVSADPAEVEALQVIADAIDFAAGRGVIVVAAAGNSGRAGVHFPASMRNTIAVGSSSWLDRRSAFSSHAVPAEIPDNGLDDDGNGWVDDVLDVVAPGELIWSTAVLSAYDALLYELLGLPGFEPGTDTYGAADGTSFSTPLVSGYVGLLLAQNPGATLGQVRQVIRSNARDILDPQGVGASLVGYDAYSGFGRLRMVVPTLTPEPNAPPVADAGPDQAVVAAAGAQAATVTLDGSGSHDPDGTLVSYQWLEGGAEIATGQTATVNLGIGSHTITLRVTDDDQASSEDQVTVEVSLPGWRLTVSRLGSGTGMVTSEPLGIACGSTCVMDVDPDTTVTLTATADAGSSFAGWGGGCAGTETCSVAGNTDTQVTATFVAARFPVAVVVNGTGGGRVTSAPAGIDCGGDCSEEYPTDMSVTLTAVPDYGSMFTGWSGGSCSGTDPCTLTVTGPTTETASFAVLPRFLLTVRKRGTGRGRVTSAPAGIDCGDDCRQRYPQGTDVVLTASPAPGHTFVGWRGGGCTGTEACTVTMAASVTVTARFTVLRLTVSRMGPGRGRVTSEPAGIDCGPDCAQPYELGTVVTLTATPAPGHTFVGWSGGGCTGTDPCTITVAGSTAVSARFTVVRLTVTKTGRGRVTSEPAGIDCGPNCAQPYTRGTTVTLTATAAPGYTFVGWRGDCTGTEPCGITVNASLAVSARFAPLGAALSP